MNKLTIGRQGTRAEHDVASHHSCDNGTVLIAPHHSSEELCSSGSGILPFHSLIEHNVEPSPGGLVIHQ
jgi:hypothetical protein